MEQEDASSDSYSDSGTSASEAGEEPIYITEIQEERLQIAEPTLNLGFDFQTLRCLKWLLVNQKDVELEMQLPPEVDNNDDYATSDEDQWSKKAPVSLKLDICINFTCEWQRCTAQFHDRVAYAQHIKEHYDLAIQSRDPLATAFSCDWDLCGFKTTDGDLFERHVMDHDRHGVFLARGEQLEAKLKLPKCHLDAMERNRLPEKIEEHRCRWDDCQATFRSFSLYGHHLTTHVPKYTTDLSCHFNKCGWVPWRKGGGSRNDLLAHLRSSHERLKFACRKCGIERAKKEIFITHFMAQVTVKEKYSNMCCKICNKLFLLPYDMQRHLRDQHQGHVCEICHTTFSAKRYLTKHINAVHLDIHKARCSVCDKGYPSIKHVELHMTTHLPPNPEGYKCKDCDHISKTVMASRSHYFKKHKRASYPYACHLCDKQYKDPKSLGVHFRRDHDFKGPPPGFHKLTFRLEGNMVYKLRLSKDHQNVFLPKYPKTVLPKVRPEPVAVTLRNVEMRNNVINVAIETTPIVKEAPVVAEEAPQIVTRAKARRLLEEAQPKKVPAKRQRRTVSAVTGGKDAEASTESKLLDEGIIILPWES